MKVKKKLDVLTFPMDLFILLTAHCFINTSGNNSRHCGDINSNKENKDKETRSNESLYKT